jgi:hypothetical protein
MAGLRVTELLKWYEENVKELEIGWAREVLQSNN